MGSMVVRNDEMVIDKKYGEQTSLQNIMRSSDRQKLEALENEGNGLMGLEMKRSRLHLVLLIV